jgi:hypothetical protein
MHLKHNIKDKLNLLVCFFLLTFLVLFACSCSKQDITSENENNEESQEQEQYEEMSEIVNYEYSCPKISGLYFSKESYLSNPDYPSGYSVCQEECIDLDTDEGT